MENDMPVPVTMLYAGLFAIMLAVLSVRVVRFRRSKKIGILTGDDQEMAQAVRVHGNFTEYVPMALILMALLELNGAPSLSIHTMGIVFAVGRLLHAIGLTQTIRGGKLRVVGMLLTFVVLVSGGATALLTYT